MVTATHIDKPGGGVDRDPRWVFLAYRLPREPSAPRLALWRAVRRLGALQVADGLVALPHSVRNLEHLQWLAATIGESHGSASVWRAQPMSAQTHSDYAQAQRAAVDAEYRSVLAEAHEAAAAREAPGARKAAGGSAPVEGQPDIERRRTVRRLRGQLRRIGSRDYFAAPSGDAAREAVNRLARSAEQVPA